MRNIVGDQKVKSPHVGRETLVSEAFHDDDGGDDDDSDENDNDDDDIYKIMERLCGSNEKVTSSPLDGETAFPTS